MSKESKQNTRMDHKEGIINFDWEGYPVIGLPHFEQRRIERLASTPINLCSKHFDLEDDAIRFCFNLLKEKREYMESKKMANFPFHTVFVTGFETDDFDTRGKHQLWFFVVFSIDTKLSDMNGICKGDTSVNLISTGIFPHKIRTNLKADTVEVVIGYSDKGDGFQWSETIPR
jgi:hypothetical protein